MNIEHSRKHGPFDLRYPPIRHTPAPESLWRLGEKRLDWLGFVARFYPGRRRHDFDVLAAYESYRDDADGAIRVARSDTTPSARGEEEPPAVAEAERWEGEGGAVRGRLRRPRRGERRVASHRVQP